MEYEIYWGGVAVAMIVFYLCRVEVALKKNNDALNEIRELLRVRLPPSKS